MNNKKSVDIYWHNLKITKENRSNILGYKNKVLWFTGLSGSGKSTLASEIELRLNKENILSYILDGDNIRHGLNSDLGFSKEDRDENIRRIGEITKLFYDAGIMVLVSFISPYIKSRKKVRELIGKDFVEIYVKCSLETCEKRDPKKIYKKVRLGEIKNFTGISDPYEEPENPEIILNTNEMSINDAVDVVMKYLNINVKK